MCAKVAIIMTTYNRYKSLEKTWKSLEKSIEGEPHKVTAFVMDDGTEDGDKTIHVMSHYIDAYGHYCFTNEKNMGLRYCLNNLLRIIRNKDFDYICYVQDDVAFKKGWLSECIKVWESKQKIHKIGFISCHDAPEHPISGTMVIEGINCLIKDTIRATHMFASAKRWYEHGEIPDLTPGIAAPKPGHGSMVDWWLVRDGPNSTLRKGEKCVILPGRCAHFGYNKSNWGCWNHEKWFVK